MSHCAALDRRTIGGAFSKPNIFWQDDTPTCDISHTSFAKAHPGMKVIIVKGIRFCGRHKPVIWSPIENCISDASSTSSSQCQFNSILQPKQLPPPGVLGNPPSMLHFPIHSKILF